MENICIAHYIAIGKEREIVKERQLEKGNDERYMYIYIYIYIRVPKFPHIVYIV